MHATSSLLTSRRPSCFAAAGTRRWHTRHSVRCNYQPGVDKDLRRNLPAAPPARAPPPPPPPPPPPAPLTSDIKMSRRGLAALLLGGSAAWWLAINGGVPVAGVDKERNVALLRTREGNLVAATTDERGRVFLFDKAGNIYYDTEDPRIGLYIVDRQGEMYNKYIDRDGKVQTAYVGNIDNLISIPVDQIGGVDVSEIQKSFKDLRAGRVTGFMKPVDPSDLSWQDLMPPNAPAAIRPDSKEILPPPILEDNVVTLEPKGFSFGGGKQQPADPVDLFNSLKREGL